MRLLVNLPKCGRVRMFGVTLIQARPRVFETRVRKVWRIVTPADMFEESYERAQVGVEAWIPEYYRADIEAKPHQWNGEYLLVSADIALNRKSLAPFMASGALEQQFSED